MGKTRTHEEPPEVGKVELDCLFAPRSVAVIGASDSLGRIGGRVLRNVLAGDPKRPVFPVNPARTEVQGRAAFPSVAAIPVAPEMAIIVVPAENAVESVRDCAESGVKAAVVLSAGFAEAGAAGLRRQDEMVEIARAAGMRLLGPNCLGLIDARQGLFATFANAFDRGFPTPGPVGVVAQSGAYGAHIASLAMRRGVGLGAWITTGNESDVDVAAGIQWMSQQPDIKVIMAYVEGVRDGARFVDALRVAHATGTKVVLMKVGVSSAGARAASSHTASLAGADRVFDSVVAQYGVLRVRTTEEQVDLVRVLASGAEPRGKRLGIVTLSGGAGVQLCDAAERHGLLVPQLSEDLQRRVTDRLPYASAANPVDVTAQALSDMDLLAEALDAVAVSGSIDSLIVFLTTTPDAPAFAEELKKTVERGLAGRGALPVALVMLAGADTVAAYESLGFLVFEDPDRAVRALAGAAQAVASLTGTVPSTRPRAARPALPPGPLNEYDAGRVLSAEGVPMARSILASSVEEAVAAADELGYPVVLKVCSTRLVHKSDLGGVELGLADGAAVRAAYDRLMVQATKHLDAQDVDGVLVCEMVTGPGAEAIVGVQLDPVFGPVVLAGMGGTLAELLDDVSLRLAPVSEEEADRMVDQLRAVRMLSGFRGGADLDRAALAQVIARVSDFAWDHAEQIDSLDLNPVRVGVVGAVALDAVLEVRSKEEGAPRERASEAEEG